MSLMYWTRAKVAGVHGRPTRAGFQGVQAPPNSSTPGMLGGVFKGFEVIVGTDAVMVGPWAIARRPTASAPRVPLTKWSWSSKTNRSEGTPVAAYAAGSNI